MQENTRNVVMMIVATLAIFIGYQLFYLSPVMEERQAAYEQELARFEAEQAARARVEAGNRDLLSDDGADAAQPSLNGAPNSAAAPIQGPIDAGAVLIDTPELTGEISLAGARFDALTLKAHREELNGETNVTLLKPFGSDDAYYATFRWGGLGAMPNGRTVWRADSETLTPDSPVTLTWDNGQGLLFSQRIEVDDKFLFTVTQSVTNQSGNVIDVAPRAYIYRAGIPEGDGLYILHEGPLGVMGGEFNEYSYTDFEDTPSVSQSSVGGWLGITDKYWMSVLIPDQDVTLKTSEFKRGRSALGVTFHQAGYEEDATSVNPGQTFARTAHLFAGAKKVGVIDDYAERLGVDLFDRTIDWGWFYFLTRPIFFLLDSFNALTGNFGIAIILLVILLKGALYPLANRQYESMAHMKEAQPKIKALQDRYKDDKARLQQELMGLYKKEKINPLAGCLPLLPQIFIFFALYKVLYVTIEMRHEPFFGWIHDLSAPDPLTIVNLFGLIPWEPPQIIAVGIWPMLMGATMYLQQKLSPTQMDETQQKVMMVLPIVFTFIMAGFSAGLVIYWTLNSALSVLQQWVILRRFEAKRGKA